MLTSTHFYYLAIVFVISVFLGIIIRIIYNSKSINGFYIRLKNVLILTIVFPLLAYKILTRHKTEYIGKINKDDQLTERQKLRLRKRLSSNKKIAIMILFNSIRRFKFNLDAHVTFLNLYKEEHGEELTISIRKRITPIQLKKVNKGRQFYEENIKGLFA